MPSAKLHARDILKRHNLKYHAALATTAASPQRNRAAKACSECAASKTRCSDERPCRRCVEKRLPCSKSNTTNRRSTLRSSLALSHDHSTSQSLSILLRPPPGTAEQHSLGANAHLPTGPQPIAADASTDSWPQVDSQDSFASLLDSLIDPPIGIVSSNPLSDPSLPLCGQGALIDLDFCLSSLLSLPPTAYDYCESALNQSFDTGSSFERHLTTRESLIAAESAKAFRASIWHWVPGPADTHLANEPDPTAFSPENSATVLAPELPSHPSATASHDLGPRDRDRVLGVILDECEKTSLVRIATSFPSSQILSKLLNTGLRFHPVGSPLAWIHAPTFSVPSTRSELLCALIACGAVFSPSAPIQTFGTAVAGLLFNNILQRWILNNTATRDIELAQAYVLVQRLLLWAGSKRTMEFGEGILQPLVTILRRSGMLQEAHSPLQLANLNGDPAELDKLWRAWARKESIIRLAHQTFVNDIQTSMTVLVNPLLSCNEMTLPLPAPDSLWEARTAAKWLERYALLPSHLEAPQTLANLTRDSFLVLHGGGTLPQSAAMPSSPTAVALLLYSLWHSIWHCQSVVSWLRSEEFLLQSYQISITAHLNLVSRVLEQLNPSRARSAPLPAQAGQENPLLTPQQNFEPYELLFHHLSLALHAPIHVFTKLAGKEGKAEGGHAFSSLREWTQSRDARKSLWHAAQLYRCARDLSPLQVRNSFVVAVYHAGLTFWAFGVIASTSSPRNLHSQPNQSSSLCQPIEEKIVLDTRLPSRLEAFIACNAGLPTLTDAQNRLQPRISVTSSPGASMRLAIQILTPTTLQHNGNDLPPFTRMVVNLMLDLVRAVQSVGIK